MRPPCEPHVLMVWVAMCRTRDGQSGYESGQIANRIPFSTDPFEKSEHVCLYFKAVDIRYPLLAVY